MNQNKQCGNCGKFAIKCLRVWMKQLVVIISTIDCNI